MSIRYTSVVLPTFGTSGNAQPSSKGRFVALAVFVLLTFTAPAIGAGAVRNAGTVYAALDKPGWAPPAGVFGPVWSLLYAGIAAAGWLVWRRAGWQRGRTALGLWGLQLVLNAGWTPLFFGARRFGPAVGLIAALDAAVAATIAASSRHSRTAAGLLVPYLGWTSFATALNASIWRRNR
jgi:tryptophan-rich sensory protein